jgi:hypothetical protein
MRLELKQPIIADYERQRLTALTITTTIGEERQADRTAQPMVKIGVPRDRPLGAELIQPEAGVANQHLV